MGTEGGVVLMGRTGLLSELLEHNTGARKRLPSLWEASFGNSSTTC